MKLNLFIIFFCFIFYVSSQQVGINTTGNAPNQSAMLDIEANDKGVLIPRLSSHQRDAIVNPADGLLIFNTDMNCINYCSSGVWYSLCGTPPIGSISSLNCSGAVQTGTLMETVAASGVSANVPYTGGNGGTHSGQTVTSTGVLGLTATLSLGTFSVGSGTLVFNITGTPTGSGTAVFALNIGGQTCNLNLVVNAPPFACGTSTVTFSYRGSTVIYGSVVSGNGRCWLDRNLGASQVATSTSDALAFGHLFQWGRLDDGHQVRTSPTTTTQANNDVPGHGNFIRHSQNWRNPKNDNLWQGVSGVNNPCPSGWRLPTLAEWTTERSSWGIADLNGAFASPLKLTAGGWRNTSGNIEYATTGFYHSSDFLNSAPANGTRMFAVENGWSGTSSNNRSNGAIVRCIKD